MSVKIGKIAELMEEWAPEHTAEEFDNVGLLVGDSTYEAVRIMTALDATSAVIEEAIEKKCQMIVAHHPLFRTGQKRINASDITGRKVIKLIENRIALYSAHTNLDKADGGVNDTLCKALGFTEWETLKDENGANSFLRVIKLEKPETLESLAEKYKKALKLLYLPIVGELDREISKIAVCSGSGMSLLKHAVKTGADLYASGDIKYHDANDALEYGIAMLDLSHYGSETVIAGKIKEYLEKKRDASGLEFEVLVSEINGQPFKL